jgi:hemoglobin
MALCILAILAASLVPSGRSFAQDKDDKSKDTVPKTPTLYQRMGGYDVISAVVDDFIDQLRKDPAFDRFGHGRAKDSSQRTKQLVKEFICWKTDGPCAYIGRDMGPAHQGLEITQKEWDASNKMLLASLEKFKVPEKEQKEFMALVEKLKEDIVEKPKKEEKPAGQN